MNKKMWWGLCSLLGLTSAMKVNEFKKNKNKKKEKNGRVVEKIFPNRRRVYGGDQRLDDREK